MVNLNNTIKKGVVILIATIANTIYKVISKDEMISIGHYVIIFVCIFACCFLGSFIRDTIYASKNNLKIDAKSLIIYDMPCAFVVAALCDILSGKIHISGWAFISLFIGIWSREFVAVLMNSKFVSAIVKYLFGRAVMNAKDSMSDDEKESLKNVFNDALNSATSISEDKKKENKSKLDDLDKPGEFEWIEILDFTLPETK